MGKQKRFILLVDDEQNILNVLKRELRQWAEKYALEIHTAPSAQIGLEILKERGSDTVIVVSDLNMPEMKGSDFLLEVKKLYPVIVSILLTANSETKKIAKAADAGIFGLMSKPWDCDCLVAELQNAFDFGESRRQNNLYLKTTEEELKWAGAFQKAILKPSLPPSTKMEIRMSYCPVPALYCEDDYYDVIFLETDRYLFLIGDVAGHGVKPAFVTGILDYQECTFRYSNAEHSHPFIVSNGKASELPVSGSAIGFTNSSAYPEQLRTLFYGDVIVLYTDGLMDIDPEGGRPAVKLSPILEQLQYGADYHRKIIDSALAVSGASAFTDDVAIVTARI